MNACEDFLQLVGIAHAVAAAIEMYVDNDTSPLTSLDPKTLGLQQKKVTLHRFARNIVDRKVNLHLVDASSCATSDGVLDYAREVLTLSICMCRVSCHQRGRRRQDHHMLDVLTTPLQGLQAHQLLTGST